MEVDTPHPRRSRGCDAAAHTLLVSAPSRQVLGLATAAALCRSSQRPWPGGQDSSAWRPGGFICFLNGGAPLRLGCLELGSSRASETAAVFCHGEGFLQLTRSLSTRQYTRPCALLFLPLLPCMHRDPPEFLLRRLVPKAVPRSGAPPVAGSISVHSHGAASLRRRVHTESDTANFPRARLCLPHRTCLEPLKRMCCVAGGEGIPEKKKSCTSAAMERVGGLGPRDVTPSGPHYFDRCQGSWRWEGGPRTAHSDWIHSILLLPRPLCPFTRASVHAAHEGRAPRRTARSAALSTFDTQESTRRLRPRRILQGGC